MYVCFYQKIGENKSLKKIIFGIIILNTFTYPTPPPCFINIKQSLLYILLLRLTMEMMKKYNTEKAIVFNTYQVRDLIDFIDGTEHFIDRTEHFIDRTENFTERTEHFIDRTEHFIDRSRTNNFIDRTENVTKRTEQFIDSTEDYAFLLERTGDLVILLVHLYDITDRMRLRDCVV